MQECIGAGIFEYMMMNSYSLYTLIGIIRDL